MFLTGILQAFGLVVISVCFNILIRFASMNYNIEAIVFASISIVSASLVLSLFAGPGKLLGNTLKNPSTWFYGLSAIGVFVLDVYLTRYVSATEMSLFGRIAIPVSLLASAFVFKRAQPKNDLIGLVFVIAGLALLFSIQDRSVVLVIFYLAIATGIVQAGEVIFAETHKQSGEAQKSGNMRDKARVIGFVSFVTSMMFLTLALTGSLIKHYILPDVSYLSFLPDVARYAHPPSIWLGILFGVFLSSLYRYFLWSASYKIKADNILALLAFVPLLTFLSEWLLSFTSAFSLNESFFTGERGHTLLIACLIITFGSAVSVFLRVRDVVKHERTSSLWNDIKNAMTIKEENLTIQHIGRGMDDYETVCAAIEHCKGCMATAAKLLAIPQSSLALVAEGRGRHAFIPEVSNDVSRNFRQNVALSDALTGLDNRTAFMAALKAGTASKSKFTVFFLDLDKFKPVNDTYGHEAGDEILKEVANRLTNTLPKSATIARIGGDEFVVLIKCDREKALLYLDKMNVTINKPFKTSVADTAISISVSVGTATYPTDATTAKDLLKIADGGMYEDKQA